MYKPEPADPMTICYSVRPNGYLNDHAQGIAKIYDGFFFTMGSWDEGTLRFLGIDGRSPDDPSWIEATRVNIASLRRAGVTENFLTVSFSQDGDWPSPNTLLSRSYTQKMSEHFAAIGQSARDLGFRGVCIDVEYPYPRYEIDNEIYSYEDYTAGDLISAAREQGLASMTAILEQFPEAVVFTLPGVLRSRPIERMYLLGLLEMMSERSATGGFHLGTEFTYCLHDPVTIAATSRFEDTGIHLLVDPDVMAYWKRHCTIAPGVWPLHMVETGGEDYPVGTWKDEVAELRQQMAILRGLAKRYVWSFSGTPVWYLYSPEIEEKYGLKKQSFQQDDIDLSGWHKILMEKPVLELSPLGTLVEQVEKFDLGKLTLEELCDSFGTPGCWWVLGMLGNPRTNPEYAASEALAQPIDPYTAYHGRDGAVRWFPFDNLDPRGITSCRYIFDWRNTDNAAAHFVTFIYSEQRRKAYLNMGWDDGIIVRLGSETVFEEIDYPPQGHGFLFRDRYIFEKRVPIMIDKGRTQLSVTSLNAFGAWIFSLRVTDGTGMPFDDIRFRLE